MKGSFVSKKESVIIQAIAVIMMVYHHLFTFPERISVNYSFLFDFPSFHPELIIAAFCKICVSIFAFCSGYGLYKIFLAKQNEHSYVQLYKSSTKRILNFYSVFWLVFIVFIPIGFFIGVYSFHIIEFLKNFFAVSYDYNGEWWYARYYILFLLLYPLIFKAMKKIKDKILALLWVVLSIVISIVLFSNINFFDGIFHEYFRFLTYLWCFITGAFFVHFSVFEKFDFFIRKKVGIQIIFLFISLVIILIRLRFVTGAEYDYLFSPLIVYLLMRIIKCRFFTRQIEKVFLYIGKYTIYIWLTHTFFSYYYLQGFTFAPFFSILILLWNLLLSLVAGIILNRIYITLKKLIKAFVKRNTDEKIH